MTMIILLDSDSYEVRKQSRGCIVTITKSVLALAAILLVTFSTTSSFASTGLKADFWFTQKDTTVFFTDNSTGSVNIVDFYWDFGDGTHSIEQNPVHDYPGLGEYNVYFRVTTSTGQVSEKFKLITLEQSKPSIPLNYAYYGALIVIIVGIAGIIIATRDTGRLVSAIVVLVGIIILIYGSVAR